MAAAKEEARLSWTPHRRVSWLNSPARNTRAGRRRQLGNGGVPATRPSQVSPTVSQMIRSAKRADESTPPLLRTRVRRKASAPCASLAAAADRASPICRAPSVEQLLSSQLLCRPPIGRLGVETRRVSPLALAAAPSPTPARRFSSSPTLVAAQHSGSDDDSLLMNSSVMARTQSIVQRFLTSQQERRAVERVAVVCSTPREGGAAPRFSPGTPLHRARTTDYDSPVARSTPLKRARSLDAEADDDDSLLSDPDIVQRLKHICANSQKAP